MTSTQWEPCEVDDRPVLGPPCPGPHIHRWTLILENEDLSLGCGCLACELSVDVLADVTAEVRGRLSFEHEHGDRGCPNAIRFLPCDCNYWWRFTPEVTP